MLKLASCFGAQFDTDILKTAHPAIMVHTAQADGGLLACLELACKEQMLIRISDSRYKFAHDQIQSAVYSMLRSTNKTDTGDHQAVDNDDLTHIRCRQSDIICCWITHYLSVTVPFIQNFEGVLHVWQKS